MHSSTRPQRGSRTTSSTGASPWWMPSCRIDRPMTAPTCSTSSGSNAAPHASGVGNVAAFHAARPVRHSSCTSAGIAQPGLPLQATLLGPQPRGALVGFDGTGAVDAGELADAVAGDLGQGRRRAPPPSRPAWARRPRSGRASSRRAAPSSPRASWPPAGRWHGRTGGPVRPRHAPPVRRRLGGDRRRRRGSGLRSAGGRCRPLERAHPFTAPVRPPTMRRWNTAKNASAGIIDSEVNARTRAVSTEYCDENACTPSGSV